MKCILLGIRCIVRDISFCNKEFIDSPPEIIIDKKSDSPNEYKSLHYAKILKDFFEKHLLINPNTFMGGTSFDSTTIYKSLLHYLKFEKAYIPLNSRSAIKNENKNYKRQCFCENPFTTSSFRRMLFIYPEKDLRAYPEGPTWNQ